MGTMRRAAERALRTAGGAEASVEDEVARAEEDGAEAVGEADPGDEGGAEAARRAVHRRLSRVPRQRTSSARPSAVEWRSRHELLDYGIPGHDTARGRDIPPQSARVVIPAVGSRPCMPQEIGPSSARTST